eukprot:CAMPEP_0116020408 /NCGR_PEP_ID=MMETSP0321-20121206/9777_1 /TAXON_ID=163516 /ORGANISM="Leptocylindrus danicus var. danicus, Strain B650" /LENGTH=552 /DNA_ID=CAMNT_0003491089 /DNA_START=110 /DNA_END=1769 /DNA_ORIENTATION=-
MISPKRRTIVCIELLHVAGKLLLLLVLCLIHSGGRSACIAAAASCFFSGTRINNYNSKTRPFVRVQKKNSLILRSSSANIVPEQEQDAAITEHVTIKPKIELRWCGEADCMISLRERVVGANSIKFDSPATGQVMYSWTDLGLDGTTSKPARMKKQMKKVDNRTILFLVKRDDEELMKTASKAIRELTEDIGIRVLLQPEQAAKLKLFGVDNELIDLFEPFPEPGFGSNTRIQQVVDETSRSFDQIPDEYDASRRKRPGPDLVVTLGGDGLLMYASQLFPGAVPPILCVAGGSLGFLTPFAKDEMVDAIKGSLGLNHKEEEAQPESLTTAECDIQYTEPVSELGFDESSNLNTEEQKNQCYQNKFQFGLDNQVNISMRMRLDCRVVNGEGIVRARFNVLNEVVIDRGSSPYLANLEAFCDDVHLTTVQADGIIFSTPTGSTAYSMAAGGSVVHPVVPAILVTPICPHVLSFRSMVFPDHVVIRCTVPDDARSDACVAFDGKFRRLLHRGDSVIIQMSEHPVPTIDRMDHTSDWLGSLKRNFNFNTRAKQKPL